PAVLSLTTQELIPTLYTIKPRMPEPLEIALQFTLGKNFRALFLGQICKEPALGLLCLGIFHQYSSLALIPFYHTLPTNSKFREKRHL
ncbi:MAG: hypothetical protein AABX71_00295, partial [Nanoarchaeota archaeon]